MYKMLPIGAIQDKTHSVLDHSRKTVAQERRCLTRYFAFFLLLLGSACTSITREPVNLTDLRDPQTPGIERARYWADETPKNLRAALTVRENQRRISGLTGNHITLTLSGGGENGAFAAGILNAWSDSGTRPEFLTVTGVSTGALAAPFAFLGSEYDDELRRLYGGLERDEILSFRNIFNILPKASVTSSKPLRRLLEEYVTDDFLAQITTEHKRGRRLLVQTVSLDAQRPVLWDMGAIASSGAPNAAEVFQEVLLASASIPGVFPPVLIEVETAAGTRDELHVDGSVYSQTAYVPGWRIPNIVSGRPTLYAIRNGRVTPEADVTDPRLFTIMSRSLDTLLKVQGAADLRGAYELGKQNGTNFNFTWIGAEFDYPLEEPFDPEYMQALYQYGYDRFKSGALWSNAPP